MLTPDSVCDQIVGDMRGIISGWKKVANNRGN